MSTPTQPSFKEWAFADLENEIVSTRRVLERVPGEHLGWKPHAKSFSLGELATHVANLLHWQVMTLTADGFDLAGAPRTAAAESRDALLRTFDENRTALKTAFDAADDASLDAPWTLRSGDHVVFSLPRRQVLRFAGISHVVHHRAQLTVYLRLLDVPVPGLYGPSADEALPPS
jgi:uncharacterized damage-inducible protein DinB